MGRILALDMGEKRIGVALSDALGILASPLTVIQTKTEKEDLETILGLVRQYEVERIVLGLPRSLDGSLGREAEKVMAFAGLLSQQVGVPVDTWDERLTTVAAERALREMGASPARKKALRDALAASIILQGYLERLRASRA